MSTSNSKQQTKSAKVIAALEQSKGASIDEICKATDWQPHSVRAFLTGLRKKGFALAKEQRGNKGRIYRITITPPPPASIKFQNAS